MPGKVCGAGSSRSLPRRGFRCPRLLPCGDHAIATRRTLGLSPGYRPPLARTRPPACHVSSQVGAVDRGNHVRSAEAPDHYEMLQISPCVMQDTIQRVSATWPSESICMGRAAMCAIKQLVESFRGPRTLVCDVQYAQLHGAPGWRIFDNGAQRCLGRPADPHLPSSTAYRWEALVWGELDLERSAPRPRRST